MARFRFYHGWWIVFACLIADLIGNALGLFGAGVYLHAMVDARNWPVADVSGAVASFYVVSAILLIPVGSAIARFGPRPVIATGALALSLGVISTGYAGSLREAYAAFVVMGVGWACLSTTAVATTLAPWFERYQGRAVSTASLGASAGGMVGAPILMLGIERIGFPANALLAGPAALAILVPLAVLVLRYRPEDMGLLPDGDVERGHTKAAAVPRWTRSDALRTAGLRSVVAAFGMGMLVQIGFLTHQVSLLAPPLGPSGASAAVTATAATALLGRLILARYADQIDQRIAAGVVLVLAAAALSVLALNPSPAVLVGSSMVLGLTVGNVTTLAPIIVRREFGSASFGSVSGMASTGIQLAAALGPSVYGVLHDAFGSYRAPLLAAALLDVAAAAIVVRGRRREVRAEG